MVRAHAAAGRQPRRGAHHLPARWPTLDVRDAASARSACRRSSCTAPASWSGTCATRATSPSTSPARATSSSRAPTRFPFIGDSDAIVEEIEEFLTGGRGGGELARGAADGDVHRHRRRDGARGRARRRPLARPARPATTRRCARSSRRFGGREVKTSATGSWRPSPGPPSRALRCALAITDAARELGIEVRIGMHTGECELIGDDVGGMAVHIASRVDGLAGPGEVLVSGTVLRHRRRRPVRVRGPRPARAQGRARAAGRCSRSAAEARRAGGYGQASPRRPGRARGRCRGSHRTPGIQRPGPPRRGCRGRDARTRRRSPGRAGHGR